jgi:hypothetical protein
MQERRCVRSGAPWEPRVAYCRAKRVGPSIVVSGTAAVDDAGQAVAPGEVYAQASFIPVEIEVDAITSS